jgi:hypothetical protein
VDFHARYVAGSADAHRLIEFARSRALRHACGATPWLI